MAPGPSSTPTFGTTSIGESTYTRDLPRALHRRMIVLADRNFAAQQLIAAIVGTGAELLIRVKAGRTLPVCRQLRDGSYVSRIGPVEVRVISREITIATSAGHQTGLYGEREKPGEATQPGSVDQACW